MNTNIAVAITLFIVEIAFIVFLLLALYYFKKYIRLRKYFKEYMVISIVFFAIATLCLIGIIISTLFLFV